MYCTSAEVLNRIQEVSKQIEVNSNGVIRYEEYIVLPYYGNIIIRFTVNKEEYTLADLDAYEKLMYECVKDEFLIDFMGEVYKKVGLKHQELDTILAKCHENYKSEPMDVAAYSNDLKEDGKYLLTLCGLSTDLDIWEIQIEEEINLFVLGDTSKELGVYKVNDLVINVYEIRRLQCEGLMKATMYAKHKGSSLVRTLMEV